MGHRLKALTTDALRLRSGQRAALARALPASLDEDAEIEEAWTAEIERRIAEIESGAVQVIPMADALAQIRVALVASKA